MAYETYAEPVVVTKPSETPADSSIKTMSSDSVAVEVPKERSKARPEEPNVQPAEQVKPEQRVITIVR